MRYLKKCLKSHQRQKGFTLLELMIVIAIVGVLAAMAAPSYKSMLEKSKIREAINEWVTSFYYAQAEAMRRQSRIVFCASDDGQTCNNNDYGVGWVVMDGNSILRDIPGIEGVNLVLSGNQPIARLDFLRTGRLSPSFLGTTLDGRLEGTVGNNNSTKMSVVINQEGRIRISE